MKLTAITKSILLCTGLLTISCSDDDDNGNSGNNPIEKTAIINTYVDIVSTAYIKSVASAETFNSALKTFATNKDEASLTTAKNAWLAAREDYQPTEAFRFYGPIEEVIDGSLDLPYEVSINAWPLDEATVLSFIADNTTFNEALFYLNLMKMIISLSDGIPSNSFCGEQIQTKQTEL